MQVKPRVNLELLGQSQNQVKYISAKPGTPLKIPDGCDNHSDVRPVLAAAGAEIRPCFALSAPRVSKPTGNCFEVSTDTATRGVSKMKQASMRTQPRARLNFETFFFQGQKFSKNQ